MNRLFGKKKEVPPPPTLGDAATSIGSRVGAIDEKIAALDKELLRYKQQMEKTPAAARAGIKKRALETLKRKKMYEQQRDMISGQQFNIDQTSFAIESIKDNQVMVGAMKGASLQLKAEHKKMNLNEIEDVQDDLYDMMEDMNEINEILGRSYGVPEGLDEDDLDAELAGLEDELTGISEPSASESIPSYLQQQPSPQLPVQPAYTLPPVQAGNTDGVQTAQATNVYGR